MSIRRISTQGRFLLAGMASLLLVLSAVLWWTNSSEAQEKPIYYQPPSGEVIVYLGPTGADAVDIPMSPADLALNGVQLVQTAEQLELLLATPPAKVEAVILHKSRVNEIDREWLRTQYDRGVVIAGVNVTMNELGVLVGDESFASDSEWENGWQREPFFSMVAHTLTGTPEDQARAKAEGVFLGSRTGSTDNMPDSSGAEVFLSLIRRDIHEIRDAQTNEVAR
jgi:hypothetical protein